MSESLPDVYLARHGETVWTINRKHTGLTDLPLTERGVRNARSLGERLEGAEFAHVFSSPLQRAYYTCELAGFKDVAVIDPDLVEWNYGDYEGLPTAEIVKKRPGWNIFDDGCPGGESLADVTARADRVIRKLRALDGGDILLFSSSHILRVLTARWLGLEAGGGRYFYLGTATLSALGYDHGKEEPVIRLWNDGRHVGD
jgi:broad specificity phosphatase PhoE